MNGDRMTPEQAVAAVGQQFAGQVHVAVTGIGPFVAGEVIAYCDKPSIIVEFPDGRRESYVVEGIRDWATGPPRRVRINGTEMSASEILAELGPDRS